MVVIFLTVPELRAAITEVVFLRLAPDPLERYLEYSEKFPDLEKEFD
ncbi:MAG: hypothetical protein Q8P56_03500 [Candidatus Uhrbacteria bacterium]|nr:hypothetical protein [Candidatus Uhrbacteria bacterium]